MDNSLKITAMPVRERLKLLRFANQPGTGIAADGSDRQYRRLFSLRRDFSAREGTQSTEVI
jgi:hypothetical protein